MVEAAIATGLARFAARSDFVHSAGAGGTGFGQAAEDAEPHGASGIDCAHCAGWFVRRRSVSGGSASEFADWSAGRCGWGDRWVLWRIPDQDSPGEGAWLAGLCGCSHRGSDRYRRIVVGGLAVLR